jgi:hypothetical protein
LAETKDNPVEHSCEKCASQRKKNRLRDLAVAASIARNIYEFVRDWIA